MKPTLYKPLGASLLLLAAAGGLVGCQSHSHRADPSPRVEVYDDYPSDYYYYPSVRVYFNIRHGYYWYHDRGRWHRNYRLPPHFVLHPRDRAHIHIDRGEPWRHHKEHAERYRPRLTPRDYDHPRMRDYDREERKHNRQQYHDGAGASYLRERHQKRQQVVQPAPRQDRREVIRQEPERVVRRERQQDRGETRHPQGHSGSTAESRQEQRAVRRHERREQRRDHRDEGYRRY